MVGGAVAAEAAATAVVVGGAVAAEAAATAVVVGGAVAAETAATAVVVGGAVAGDTVVTLDVDLDALKLLDCDGPEAILATIPITKKPKTTLIILCLRIQTMNFSFTLMATVSLACSNKNFLCIRVRYFQRTRVPFETNAG